MYVLNGAWVKNAMDLVGEGYKHIRLKKYVLNPGQRHKLFKALRRSYLFVGTPLFFGLFSLITYYSYSLYYEQTLSSRKDRIEGVQANVRQALNSFLDFLDLQASRIERSDQSGDEIIAILRTDPTSFIDSPLPGISSLTFTATSTQKVYSRLGEVMGDEVATSLKTNPHDILVKLDREISGVGLLKSTVSLNGLVPNDFRDVSSSSPLRGADGFVVDTGGDKLVLQLAEPNPTFSSFLYHYSTYVYLLVLAMFASLYIGILFTRLAIRRRNKVLRSVNESMERKYQMQIENNAQLEKEGGQLKSRLALFKKGVAMREALLTSAITNYRTVCSSCYSTYNISAQLLQNGYSENKAIMEIVSIAKSAHQNLYRLSEGYPLTDVQRPVFLKQVIEDVVDAYSHYCQENAVMIEVKGEKEAVLNIDEGSLRVIVYNILRHILRKYINHILVAIDPVDTGFQIQFIDDGLETERVLCSESKNILSLSREEMIEIALNIGWRISYRSDEDRCVTILCLPDTQASPENVVSLNDFRKHA